MWLPLLQKISLPFSLMPLSTLLSFILEDWVIAPPHILELLRDIVRAKPRLFAALDQHFGPRAPARTILQLTMAFTFWSTLRRFGLNLSLPTPVHSLDSPPPLSLPLPQLHPPLAEHLARESFARMMRRTALPRSAIIIDD